MSNNAVAAYEYGEKPISKWKKSDILAAVAEIDPKKAELFRKAKLSVLKEYLLVNRGWHHTSLMYNQTDFYAIDEDYIREVSPEDIDELASLGREPKEAEERVIYKGDFSYLEWVGSRNYRRAIEHVLENVTIEEKGCYYIVYGDDGKQIVRKMIGSKGTCVKRGG